MKDLKVNIVNAHELNPKKVYILELSHESYTMEDAHNIANAIYKSGIKSIVTIRQGKKEIKVIEAK